MLPPPLLQPERPFGQWEIAGLDGAPALFFAECDSTHRYVRSHLETLTAGSLVVANSQTSGRGRHDRIWRAPADKNLSFNLLVPLDGLAPEHWAQTTQIAALSLATLLRSWEMDVSVKWPNDLLWKKHKICGILSELLRQDERRLLSLGIGLNVNTAAEDFVGLDRLATSLHLISGQNLNREEILRRFLQQFQADLQRFRAEGPGPWIAEWRTMDQFLGSPARIVGAEGSLAGTILDIQNDGSLLFRTEDGQTQTIWSGDLEI